MACRDTINTININTGNRSISVQTEAVGNEMPTSLGATPLFGVDSTAKANTVLQNNLTEFDWVTRNKLYPNFWGRYIGGENAVTAQELSFIHKLGCKVAFIYNGYAWGQTSKKQQGFIDGEKATMAASELGVPEGTAIFLDVEPVSEVTEEYMLGFAQSLLQDGYVPGFRANTDANFGFDRQFCRGVIDKPEILGKSLIWAIAPNLPEYFRTNDSHNLYPDSWTPYCPSCMTQDQISIWQYGSECHPINDSTGKPTHFNLNLVRKPSVILNRMY